MNRKPANREAENTAWHQKLIKRKQLEAEIELLAFGARLDEFNSELEKEFKEIFGEKT